MSKYILCIAEKPSVAKDIARVVGATSRKDGYFEGNGYRVTWAVGHLITLCEPEEYGYVSQADMYKEKKSEAMNELPLLPSEFKYKVIESVKDQFKIVRDLMLSDLIAYNINFGDCGTEGELIQYLIRWKVGYKGVVKRAYLTSMTDEAIKTALDTLRPQEEFKNVIEGALCRQRADWILGMSLSRAESLKYNANISVGRVQTPTLFFIVSRYMAVSNFKVTNYYGMELKLKEGFSVFWSKDTDGLFDNSVKDTENRVLDENCVKARARECVQSGVGKVVNYEVKKSGTDRPQLYDITELERDANKRFGYSPATTLACAQCLYETHKVLSYPRTDSRYITSDLAPYMKDRLSMISTVKGFNDNSAKCVDAVLAKGLNIDKKIVDDSKVTDHHALIPTEKIKDFDFDTLEPSNAKEKKEGVTKDALKNVLGLVLSRFIVAFSTACYYNLTKVTVEAGKGLKFTASGKTILDNGWIDVQNILLSKDDEDEEKEDNEEQRFPNLSVGQSVTVSDCIVKAKKTTPPKLHTEATLLTAMETAGKGEKGGEILRGKGIGTQATRAEIIKSLFDKGYCEFKKQGKTNYIVPTVTGIKIIKILPKELYSPMITADWEYKISQIAEGKYSSDEFMREFEKFIIEKVDEVKNSNFDITFEKTKEVVCDCPFCGAPMYYFDGKDKNGNKASVVYCSEKCGCSLNADTPFVKKATGKSLTFEQMKEFLSKGSITLRCKSLYDEKKYFSREYILTKTEKNGKNYANFKAGKIIDNKSKKATRKKSGSGLF